MPSEILGAPTHTLIIHVVVVLVPLSAIGAFLVCVVPFIARRYTGLVVAAALACIPATALAASAGEVLERQLRRQAMSATESGLVAEHARLADSLLPFVIVLAAGSLLFAVSRTLLDHRQAESATGGDTAVRSNRIIERVAVRTRRLSTANLVRIRWAGVALTLVGALLSSYLVIRIGHLGAQAAWTGVVTGS